MFKRQYLISALFTFENMLSKVLKPSELSLCN